MNDDVRSGFALTSMLEQPGGAAQARTASALRAE